MFKRLNLNLDKGVFSKLSLYLLASIISSGLNIAINPFLAINLSPSDYAIIGYYISLNTLFLPLISFRLLSFYSRKYYLAPTERLKDIRNTILTFQLCFGIVISAIIIISFYYYARYTNLSFDVYPYLIMSVGSVFFGGFMTCLLTENRLKGNAKSFFAYTMVGVVLNIAMALLFVVAFKWGATGRFLGMFITSILTAIIAVVSLRFKLYICYDILKEALRFSWPILFTGLLYFVFGGYDRILLEKLGNNEELGLYNVAFQITAYINVLGLALRQTFEPNIYKATAKNEIGKSIKIMLFVFGLMLCVCLVFNLVAFFVIDILTFGKYVDAVHYAEVLVFRNAALVLAFMTSDILIGLGYPKMELINRIIGSVLVLIGFKFIIDKYGYIGAAWGQSFALLLMGLISVGTLIYLIFSKRKIKNKN